MKKRLLTLLLGLSMTGLLFTGCGGGKTAEAPAAQEETAKEEAPAEEEAAEEEAPAEEEAAEEEAPAEEEAAEEGSSDGSFSLLDVDESMVDVGAYGTGEDGTELVFTMFTGPDGNKYVSLFGFDNNGGSGDVICGQYEASSEVDEDGDEWTYFDVTDVYTSQHFNLGVCERPETQEVVFFDSDQNIIKGKFLTASETIDYMGSAAALISN